MINEKIEQLSNSVFISICVVVGLSGLALIVEIL